VENGAHPSWNKVEFQSPMLRALQQQFDSLIVREGVLYRKFYNPASLVNHYQLILPAEMKVTSYFFGTMQLVT